MRKTQLIAILLFCLVFGPLGAQTEMTMPKWHFIDQMIIPSPSEDMPDYVRLLYAEEVDMQALDRAFAAHYEAVGWDHQMEDLEEDPYAKFFHHWYTAAQPFVDDDAKVKVMTTEELLEWRKAVTRSAQVDTDGRDPSSTWSFVGPKQTIWRADDWAEQPVAPWQINIYCIAAAPSNPSILYCGSETGALYKSVDKGQSWQAFQDYNWGRAILSVAIHPNDPDIVYAATSTDIFKTTDGGDSWSILLTESGLSCNSIAISPSAPEVILAGTANGLYRSSNGGQDWTEILPQRIDDVQFRPNDGTVAYVLARRDNPDSYAFYKSTNSGENFSLAMSGWGNIFEESGGRLTVTPADPDYVYAILLSHDGTGNNRKPYILKSTDAAANWTTVAICDSGDCPLNNGQGYYDLDIVASHSNAEEIIAATTTAYRSTDGGNSWTAVGGYTGDFAIHPDIQEMISIMDGGVENTWITTDGGINYSTDFYNSTANWEARIDGLDGTDFWGFAQGWNEDYVIGGRYHNGNTAIHENYPDKQALRMGGAESVTGWAMHGRERYAAFDDIAEVIVPAQIDQRPEGSFLFSKHPQNFYYGDAFSRVMVDLEDFMTIYLGEGNSFWRSKDGGASWEATHNFTGKPYHFDISRADPNYIYLTADDGFYRSTDRGESFTEMNLPPGLSDWHSQNLRVAASSTNPDQVWVLNHRSGASSNAPRVFMSTDGGNSWMVFANPSLNGRKWTAIAHQVGTDGGIYIASSRGPAGSLPSKVFYRDASMNDWVDFSAGLPQSANPIKLLPFYRDGKLRWAGNRGVWEIDFYQEEWAPIAQPFVSGREQICIRDTVELDSYSVARGDASFSWDIPGAVWSTDLAQREVKALFPGPGTYTATLTVLHNGQEDTKSLEFVVNNECNVDPRPGNAISMSGASTDFAASASALGITTNSMTLSAWIKRDGIQPGFAGIVFMRQGTANGLNFRENNELGYHWNNSQWWWGSGLFVPDQEWAHVAMVVRPNGVTLYLNGVSSTNNVPTDLSTFNGVLNFGADPPWGGRRFKGQMDEVVVYDRALSQAEIRELMHLTKVPEEDESLIAYWQFNREEGIITDRVGSNHASLLGGSARVRSTAPVGPGESARLDVTAAGSYDFENTDLNLVFPVDGTIFPNGELCVSRIDYAPDELPNEEETSPAYWIVHNYGNNNSFSELSSMTFSNLEVTEFEASNPDQISLFKRASNADGDTWNELVDLADEATAGPNGSITFSEGNGQTSFSQFIMSFAEMPVNTEDLVSYAEPVVLYPNPIAQGGQLQLKTTVTGPITVKLYAMDGELVQVLQTNGNSQIDLPRLAQGAYSYLIETDSWRKSGVLVVE